MHAGQARDHSGRLAIYKEEEKVAFGASRGSFSLSCDHSGRPAIHKKEGKIAFGENCIRCESGQPSIQADQQ